MRTRILFCVLVTTSFLLTIPADLSAITTASNVSVDLIKPANDSISYFQLTKLSPKKIAKHLGIAHTNQSKFYLRYLRRQIKNILKLNPQLTQAKLNNNILIKEIEESNQYEHFKETVKWMFIIVGIILLGAFLVTSAMAIKNSR